MPPTNPPCARKISHVLRYRKTCLKSGEQLRERNVAGGTQRGRGMARIALRATGSFRTTAHASTPMPSTTTAGRDRHRAPAELLDEEPQRHLLPPALRGCRSSGRGRTASRTGGREPVSRQLQGDHPAHGRGRARDRATRGGQRRSSPSCRRRTRPPRPAATRRSADAWRPRSRPARRWGSASARRRRRRTADNWPRCTAVMLKSRINSVVMTAGDVPEVEPRQVEDRGDAQTVTARRPAGTAARSRERPRFAAPA